LSAVGKGFGPGEWLIGFDPCPPSPGPEVVLDVPTKIPVEHTPRLGPGSSVEPHPVQDLVIVGDSVLANNEESSPVRVEVLLESEVGGISVDLILIGLEVPRRDPDAHTVNGLGRRHVVLVDVDEVSLLKGSIINISWPSDPSADLVRDK
jgi:hypothetical protein